MEESHGRVISVYKQVVNVNSELKKIVASDTDDIKKLEAEINSWCIEDKPIRHSKCRVRCPHRTAQI